MSNATIDISGPTQCHRRARCVEQSMSRPQMLTAMSYGGAPHESLGDVVMSGEESGDVVMETIQRQSLEPGEPAPDFRLPSTRGLDVALSDFQGHKHVLLAFLRGMT
jgi:hypothetical protein